MARKQNLLKKKYYATGAGRKHRRMIKMLKKINPYLYVGGLMIISTIMLVIYDYLIQYSEQIFIIVAALTIMIVACVIIYLGNLAYGTIHHAKRTKIETDKLDGIKEQEVGKGRQERNRAELMYVEADKIKADTEIKKAEAEVKRQEAFNMQFDGAKKAIEVEGMKLVLSNTQKLIDKAILSDSQYTLNIPGVATLAPKTSSKITNNYAGELGPGNQEQRINFLQHIKDRCFNRIGLIGAQGGGKTTALRWYADLLNEIRPGGKKFVLDPHAPPHKWPSNYIVIGAGRNYFEITKFFVWLFNEAIPRRYSHQAKGKTNFSPVDILSDEWVTIVANMRKTEIWSDENVLALFTEPRKINIGMALCLHDTTNKSFGISSGASLKGALQANFYFNEDDLTGERTAKLGVGIPGKTKIIYYPCDMPGPYPERFHSEDATEQETDDWMKENEERINRLKLAPASGDVMDLSDFIAAKSKPNNKKATDEEVEAAVSEWMSVDGIELNRDEIAQKLGYAPGSGSGSKRVKEAAKRLGYL